MNTLIPILIFGLLFAHLTEKTTLGVYGDGTRQTTQNKLFFFALLCVLAFHAGLRTTYNDTGAYIRGFNESPTVFALLNAERMHILTNPAFKVYTAIVHDLTDNYHIYFLIPAFFVQYAFISTIRRYSASFTLGIGLYICLGTYVFSLAAMKQTLAMAILMLGIPKLQDKKYLQYYLLVFVAFLFHTYAIAFAVLPLLAVKPWKAHTFILLFVVFVIMQNFESIIGSFLDYANEQGKDVAEYEVFDNAQVNIFRVAVYAVVPLLSLCLRAHLFRDEYDSCYNVLIHMSIISFSFMLLGTVNGANMFGRMANYFEFGMICSLAWIVRRAFTRESARIITIVAVGCFLFYFYYAYKITLDFDEHYRAVTIVQFVQSLFAP